MLVRRPRPKARLGSRRQPKESRAAILRAAVEEFSREGVAGARTDAIARAAHVNKALLYYYFRDKEALYDAVLDHVFGGLTEFVHDALACDRSPREKILAYAGAHFDYIAGHPLYPRIVQGEMSYAARERSRHFGRIVEKYFRPLFGRLAEILKQGSECGQFRPVNPFHFIPSMISMIVFYFTSAPVMRLMTKADPMTPERLAERRAAVLDFIAAALFATPQAAPRGVHK